MLIRLAIWVVFLVGGVSATRLGDIISSLNDPLSSSDSKFGNLQQLDKMTTLEAIKASAHLYFFGNEFIVPNYEKSLEKYLLAYEMDKNDGDVLFMLGLHYSYGVGCPLDIVKGVMFLHFAARLHHVPALNALGYAYNFGIGVDKKCSYSKIYYYKAAKRSLLKLSPKDAVSVKKPIRLSLEPVDSQAETLEYYEYSAKTGDPSALLLLAQLYYFGTDILDPDLVRARKFFEEAAHAGSESAYAFLGMIYYRGEGVEVDYQKAKEYFSIAAEFNVASAVNGLGLLYWYGHGVSKDLDAAEILFKRARDLKYAEAFYNHAMVLLEQSSPFSSDTIYEDILTASKAGYVHANLEVVKRYLKSDSSCSASVYFLRQVVEKGEAVSLSREAYRLYMNGHQDQSLSRYIYLAAQGIEIANFNAAFILENADDRKHLLRSIFFYRRSALLGNAIAQTKIGNFIYSGAYGPPDYTAAAGFYYLAARNAVPAPEAMFNLAHLFEYGIGLKEDFYSAIDMYRAALNREKNAFIAVNLSLLRCKSKLWLSTFRNLFNSEHSSTKTKNPTARINYASEQLVIIIMTILLKCFIYWYINYYQNPRHARQPRRPPAPISPQPQVNQPTGSVSEHHVSDADSATNERNGSNSED